MTFKETQPHQRISGTIMTYEEIIEDLRRSTKTHGNHRESKDVT